MNLAGNAQTSLNVTNIATNVYTTVTCDRGFRGLTWDSTNSTLYGYSDTGTNGYYSINPSTGVTALVGVGTLPPNTVHKPGDLTTLYGFIFEDVGFNVASTVNTYTFVGDIIGDTTARTDTDTAQPLFTRIK